MPPNIAPIQIVIVPIPGHEKALVLAQEIYTKLKTTYRCELDLVDDESAGFKFNKWELKGVPLRLEIGDRDVANNSIVVYRRDTGEKINSTVEDLNKTISNLSLEIQNNLFTKHQKFTKDNTFIVDSYEEFKKVMSTTRGFIKAHWCENAECEAQIKSDTKATTRCLPLDAQEESGKCILCGKPSTHRWLFAQSY